MKTGFFCKVGGSDCEVVLPARPHVEEETPFLLLLSLQGKHDVSTFPSPSLDPRMPKEEPDNLPIKASPRVELYIRVEETPSEAMSAPQLLCPASQQPARPPLRPFLPRAPSPPISGSE